MRRALGSLGRLATVTTLAAVPLVVRLHIAIATLTAAATLVVPLATAPTADAAGSVRSAVSLSAPPTTTYGSAVTLRGVLGRAGTNVRIAGARVILQRANPGRANWTSVTSTLTASHGGYGFRLTAGRPFDYRVIWPGNATYTLAVSTVRFGAVRPMLTWTKLENPMDNSVGYVRAEGARYPMSSAEPFVYLQRYDAKANAWRNIAYARSKVVYKAKYGIDAGVGPSTAYYRVYTPPNGGYSAAVSAPRRLTVYTARGAFARPLVATGGANHPAFRPHPASTDPQRNHAGAWAARGGAVWADLNTAGCRLISPWFKGIEGVGGRAKVSIIVGGRTAFSSTVPDPSVGYPDPLWRTVYTRGHRTVRLQVTDIDTKAGPRILFYVQSQCNT